MSSEGIVFKTNVDVGKTIDAKELLYENDAVLLAVGSTLPRDLPIPGKETLIKHATVSYYHVTVSCCTL